MNSRGTGKEKPTSPNQDHRLLRRSMSSHLTKLFFAGRCFHEPYIVPFSSKHSSHPQTPVQIGYGDSTRLQNIRNSNSPQRAGQTSCLHRTNMDDWSSNEYIYCILLSLAQHRKGIKERRRSKTGKRKPKLRDFPIYKVRLLHPWQIV